MASTDNLFAKLDRVRVEFDPDYQNQPTPFRLVDEDREVRIHADDLYKFRNQIDYLIRRSAYEMGGR